MNARTTMEKRVAFGKRTIAIGCSDKCMPRIYKHFLRLMRKRGIKKALMNLMDEFDVPNHVIVNFKGGKGDLYAQYFVYEKAVAEHLIIIDIYTKPFEKRIIDIPDYDLDHELIDTFAHELIHHVCASERKTLKRTKEFMNEVAQLL